MRSGRPKQLSKVHVSTAVREYIAKLVEETRKGAGVALGVSPRVCLQC